MKPATKVCACCDCVCDPEEMFRSLSGAGPFCSDCWEMLTDADQSLLMQKELERAEDKIEELATELRKLKSV